MKIATVILGVLIPSMACAAPPVTTGEPTPDLSDLFAMQRAVQQVCSANKWLLKIPHVERCGPSETPATDTSRGEPAVGIFVDDDSHSEEVERKIPPRLGGFPTVVWPTHIEGTF